MTPKTPTHNFTHSFLLNVLRLESHGVQKLFLSRDHLVEVLVCIEVERGLNPRVTTKQAEKLPV